MSKKESVAQEVAMPARLEVYYRETVVPKLMERFKYKSIMMVPRLEKISVNIGVGEAAQEPKLLETAMQELGQITGQKPQVRKAKKAISNFKRGTGHRMPRYPSPQDHV